MEDLRSQLEHASKSRGGDKPSKQTEAQLLELQQKLDEAQRAIVDLQGSKNKLVQESADLVKSNEDLDHQVNALQKLKQQTSTQLDEARHSLEEEVRAKAKLASDLRNMNTDLDGMRETLEEEQAAKADLQRQLAKANADIQQLRSKFEGEGKSFMFTILRWVNNE